MTDLDAALFAAVVPRGFSVRDQLDDVRTLVDAGADVMARGATGQTPLHAAVRAPRFSSDPLPDLTVVEYLLDHGADIHAMDDVGVTPIGRALPLNGYLPSDTLERSIELLRLLLARGARLEPFPRTAARLGGRLAHLLRCADAGTFAFVAEQVGGFDLTETDEHGDTPLHAVVGAARPALVRMVLDWSAKPGDAEAAGTKTGVADLSAVNRAGQTPLATALWSSWYDYGPNKIVAMLEAVNAPAGLPPRFAGGIPRPVDPIALTQAIPGLPDNPRLRGIVAEGALTYQDLVAALARGGGPDAARWIIEVCRATLGDDTQDWRLPGDLAPETPFVHHGDLMIRGHLLVTTPVVVTGSLAVTGVVELDGPEALLAIGGNAQADAVVSGGSLHIDGWLRASTMVYGHGDGGAMVASSITAPVIIAEGHRIDGETRWITLRRETSADERQWHQEVFVASVLVDDGHGPHLSRSLLSEHLRRHHTVLRLISPPQRRRRFPWPRG